MTVAELRASIFSDLGIHGKAAALEAIRAVLTEENTDTVIAMVTNKLNAYLPFYLRWLPVGMVLDKLLPEVLLNVFEDILS